MRSVKYSCTNKRIKWRKVMYDGVRGLFLPVLPLKHSKPWLVPEEGAEHPEPCGNSGLHLPLALCWRQGPLSASSEDGPWQGVWARPKFALDPGGGCATPSVLSALALSSQWEQGRAWERLLLTSPGTVPDGWVVIYISWNPVHLPELLREEMTAFCSSLFKAWD